jgi:hypothetical protein
MGTGGQCAAVGKRGRVVDSTTHPTLRLGQYAHPLDEAKRRATGVTNGANAITQGDWATGLFAGAAGGFEESQ